MAEALSIEEIEYRLLAAGADDWDVQVSTCCNATLGTMPFLVAPVFASALLSVSPSLHKRCFRVLRGDGEWSDQVSEQMLQELHQIDDNQNLSSSIGAATNKCHVSPNAPHVAQIDFPQ